MINKLPHLARATIKKLVHQAFTARSYKQELALARKLIEDHREAFPAAMKCLEHDLEGQCSHECFHAMNCSA